MSHSTPAADDESASARVTPSTARTVFAAIALALPAAAVAITGAMWMDALPHQLAIHWGASGRPDGFIPAEVLWGLTVVASVLFSGAGVAALLITRGDADDKRKAVTIAGTVSALAAAAWIVPAVTTHTAGSAAQASLEGWMLLFVAALVYGIVPRLLMPRT